MSLKLTVLGYGLFGLVSLWGVHQATRINTLNHEIAGHEACVGSLTGKAGSALPASPPCDADLIHLYDRAKASGACEASLQNGDLSPRCTPSVQALYVSADALKTQIDTLRADQDAAIARAEARGQSTALRKYQNDTAINAAPVADDGLIVCDADCLRRRAQSLNRPRER